MNKILYIENVASIDATSFYMSAALAAKKNNLEFHLAYNAIDYDEKKAKLLEELYGVHFHQIDFIRAPYDLRNIKAYKQICELIDREGIDYIHCNTPIGGVVGRLAGNKCKVKKIIYQAHGFHFYEGASFFNWAIYYPIEKILARCTDILITINKEDFERSKKFNLKKHGKRFYVPGVGIDVSKYNGTDELRLSKRQELGLKSTDIAFISMGDLIGRKNYEIAIEAFAKVSDKSMHYYICGKGPNEEKLKDLVLKHGMETNIHFLGYRKDIKELLCASDVYVLSSKQEGLSRALMEAMAMRLPCITSAIRGNTDLMNTSKGGFLCQNLSDYISAIEYMKDKTKRLEMGNDNKAAIELFSIESVTEELAKIYAENIM